MLTEKQLHDRRKGIGGSDIGIIMGCQEDTTAAFKGKSIVDIYLSKVDPLYENKINDSMAFGNHIEEFIVRMFETKTGWSVVRENATRKSTTHPILIGNIDGFIPTVNAVLEVKNVDPSKAWLWGEDGSDEIPEYYLYQCAHYAHVYNVQKVYIAAYFGGARFKIYLFERNMDLEKIIINKAEKFWADHVEKRVPPKPEDYEDCSKVYASSIAKSEHVADQDIQESINELISVQASIKDMSEKENSLKTKICSAMESNEILLSMNGDKLATWKTQTAKRIDTAKLKAEYPDIASAVTTESTSRVFRVSK